MSAYICDNSVFATLGAFAALTLDVDAQQAADLLQAENVRSVNCRYSENTQLPAVDISTAIPAPDRSRLLELCGEYDYQACETEDYNTTAAAILINRIRSAAVAHVPGDVTAWQPGDMIGHPVYDARLHRRGYVVDTDTSANQTYTLGAGGMQAESREELDIVWIPESADASMRRSREPVSRAAAWLASQYNWPPISPAQAESLAADQEQEENAQRRAAELKRQQIEQENAEFRDRLAGVMPNDCRGVIVAELQVNECDSMTDYFASSTTRVIVLGFSAHNRNNFNEIRKAIAAADLADLPELAKLADKEQGEECRENWSMGKGYYLQERNASAYSGWKVRKVRAWGDNILQPKDVPQGDIRAPGCNKSKPESNPAQPAAEHCTGVVMRLNDAKQGVELIFPSKPAAEVRNLLKAHGFRWSRNGGFWYAKQTPERMTFAQGLADNIEERAAA